MKPVLCRLVSLWGDPPRGLEGSGAGGFALRLGQRRSVAVRCALNFEGSGLGRMLKVWVAVTWRNLGGFLRLRAGLGVVQVVFSLLH